MLFWIGIYVIWAVLWYNVGNHHGRKVAVWNCECTHCEEVWKKTTEAFDKEI